LFCDQGCKPVWFAAFVNTYEAAAVLDASKKSGSAGAEPLEKPAQFIAASARHQ
jgi:hypothetical protein